MATGDEVASRRHVTLILRLVVQSDGRLVYGEVVDLDSYPKGRFTAWRGLLGILRTTLAAAE